MAGVGLLAEFGIWVGRSAAVLERRLPELMDEPTLPDLFKPILLHTLAHLRQIEQRVEEGDARIAAHAKGSEAAQRVQKISGVGAVTTSALVATIGNPQDFRNGRQMAAWAGLVPSQDSSGGKTKLGKISKRGDSYLRGLLTQGARSTLQVALKREPRKRSRLEQWIVALHGRVGYHKTLVAIANKHLQMIWAILAKGEAYDSNAWRHHHSLAPTPVADSPPLVRKCDDLQHIAIDAIDMGVRIARQREAPVHGRNRLADIWSVVEQLRCTRSFNTKAKRDRSTEPDPIPYAASNSTSAAG